MDHSGIPEEDTWENYSAADLEKVNNALTADRQAIIQKQKRLAPILELKMREERALRNMRVQADLNGAVPIDQVIEPPGIESEEKFGSM